MIENKDQFINLEITPALQLLSLTRKNTKYLASTTSQIIYSQKEPILSLIHSEILGQI